MELSNYYRLNQQMHWVYSLAHNWYIFFALPISMLSSLILAITSYLKINDKYFWIFISSIPIILFLFLPIILKLLNLR